MSAQSILPFHTQIDKLFFSAIIGLEHITSEFSIDRSIDYFLSDENHLHRLSSHVLQSIIAFDSLRVCVYTYTHSSSI